MDKEAFAVAFAMFAEFLFIGLIAALAHDGITHSRKHSEKSKKKTDKHL